MHPFAVSRISPATASKAVERAIKCAADYDTQCILSGEIGFNAPAAFLYSADQGFRVVLAPKVVPLANEGEGGGEGGQKLVRVNDPASQSTSMILRLNSTVAVEYVTPGSRSVVVETLTGSDAYCVQALRASVSPSCWEELD